MSEEVIAEKAFPLNQGFECKCGKSRITISPESTRVVCGVIGLVDLQNARVGGGIVECSSCSAIIYNQKERSK